MSLLRALMIDRRKLERIDVDEVAYISGDGASLRCHVVNISEQGGSD